MLIEHLNRQLREREAQGLQRQRRIAESPCAPHQRVSRHGQPARDLLAFCSNDYLGLAAHPALQDALAEGAQHFGAGSGASHLINGHSRAHAALEADLANWLTPCIPNAQALTFCTGYMANLALLTALGDASATVFADKLNHASLIDGALLAKAPMQRYPHGNLAILAKQLARCSTPVKLIVTDAVFSMDGDLADLPALLALAERFDAWLVVDDAHGFGVLGVNGGGVLSHFGLDSAHIAYVGTLGKAAGVSGAFVAGSEELVELLIQRARAYVYTTASPPALAAALLRSVEIMAAEGWRRQRLVELTARLAGVLELRNWHLRTSSTAIQPLIIGGNHEAVALSDALATNGILVPAIRPPTVPKGSARLRISLSAAHTEGDVDRLVEELQRAEAVLS